MGRFVRYPYDPGDPAGIPEEREDVATIPPDVRRKPYQEDPGGGGVPPGVFDPGMPPGVAARRRLYGQYPPHIYPPPDAFILDLPLVRAPATAIPAAGSAVMITWPRIPQGRLGIVRKLAAVVTLGILADVRWTTQLNGAPITPFPGVRGAIGALEQPQDTQILLNAGDVFTLLAENTGGAGVSVLARSYGWMWTDEKL